MLCLLGTVPGQESDKGLFIQYLLIVSVYSGPSAVLGLGDTEWKRILTPQSFYSGDMETPHIQKTHGHLVLSALVIDAAIPVYSRVRTPRR